MAYLDIHNARKTYDSFAALDQLADLGIGRVMTSGGCETALAGAPRIALLVAHAANRIELLPAGKINAANVAELIRRTRCTQVHAAVRTPLVDPTAPADSYEVASPPDVIAVRATLKDLKSR